MFINKSFLDLPQPSMDGFVCGCFCAELSSCQGDHSALKAENMLLFGLLQKKYADPCFVIKFYVCLKKIFSNMELQKRIHSFSK